MWITKKKWNEMRDVINKLNLELTRQCDDIDRIKTRLVTKYNHAVDTDEIKGITLEELTKFIIDKNLLNAIKLSKLNIIKENNNVRI